MDTLYDELALTTLRDVATGILKDDNPENLKKLLDLAETVIPLPPPDAKEIRRVFRNVLRFPFLTSQVCHDEINDAYAYAERRRNEYLRRNQPDYIAEMLRSYAAIQNAYERVMFQFRLKYLTNPTGANLQRFLEILKKNIPPQPIRRHVIAHGYRNLTTCELVRPDETRLEYVEVESWYKIHGSFSLADRLRDMARERLLKEKIIS